MFFVAACGGASPNPPVAQSTTLNITEDTAGSGQLSASDPNGKPMTYLLTVPPVDGAVEINSATGAFTFQPKANFNGTDRFQFIAVAGRRRSAAATVNVIIEPVNDSPVFDAMIPLTNSAESAVLRYHVPLTDIDGDVLALTANSSNSAVARVEIDEATGDILIAQIDYGTATIAVSGSDSEYTVSGELVYSVEDVTKSRSLESSVESPRQVVITNGSLNNVRFTLRHNGQRLDTSIQSMLDSITDMSSIAQTEPFESKIWRFVRDSVYHEFPLSTHVFVHDPLTLINSIGWGTCDDVAIAYMHLARAAGREARVWYLEGHVVPEVNVDGIWRMYDPDLFVYYLDADSLPASVDELSQLPSLITAPITPIFSNTAGLTAYSEFLADIYASTANNQLADDLAPELVAPVPAIGAAFDLPPGATITYPGIWAPKPGGFDGANMQPVAVAANLRIDLPAGWVGTIRLPLLLAAVYGSGQILVDGLAISGDGYEITDSYQPRQVAPQEIDILQSDSPISIVFLLNPMRFVMMELNDVKITGRDVYALEVTTSAADPDTVVDSMAVASVRKPVP